MTHILLIEDDEILRPVLASVLRHAGYSVVEAIDGRQGLELARTVKPALVLTDLVMPEKEGIETIRELSAAPDPPAIIAMSGAPSASTYLALAAKLGAGRTLRKPFRAELLIDAVRQAIGLPQPASPPAELGAPDRPLKFVVLDDEPGPRVLNRRALQKTFPGCQVIECSTIDDALVRCVGQPLDAVLADHHLGGQEGVTLVRRLREERVECPILMVTGSSDPQVRVKAYAAGVTRVFSPGDLDFAQYLRGLLIKSPPDETPPPAAS